VPQPTSLITFDGERPKAGRTRPDRLKFKALRDIAGLCFLLHAAWLNCYAKKILTIVQEVAGNR
jgi:hypothetical protein